MKHPLNGSSLSRKILMALAALLVIVYFYPHPEANRFIYQEGRPWNYSKLIAPFDIPIHADSATILAARDTLEKRFVPIYSVNQLLIDTIVSRLPESHDRNLRRRLAARFPKRCLSIILPLLSFDGPIISRWKSKGKRPVFKNTRLERNRRLRRSSRLRLLFDGDPNFNDRARLASVEPLVVVLDAVERAILQGSLDIAFPVRLQPLVHGAVFALVAHCGVDVEGGIS